MIAGPFTPRLRTVRVNGGRRVYVECNIDEPQTVGPRSMSIRGRIEQSGANTNKRAVLQDLFTSGSGSRKMKMCCFDR